MEGNLKLILGLIWTLILHYQISIGFNLDDNEKGKKGPTPRQALMGYVQVSLSVHNLLDVVTLCKYLDVLVLIASIQCVGMYYSMGIVE